MQQFIIHLNGGYNPFVRLGRGALGYRPNRRMIGRGDRLHHGGGGGGPPSDDEEDDNYLSLLPSNYIINNVENDEHLEDEFNELIHELNQILPKVDKDDKQQGGGGGGTEPESEIVTKKEKEEEPKEESNDEDESTGIVKIKENNFINQIEKEIKKEIDANEQAKKNANTASDKKPFIARINELKESQFYKTIKKMNSEIQGFNDKVDHIQDARTDDKIKDKQKYINDTKKNLLNNILRFGEYIKQPEIPEDEKKEYYKIFYKMYLSYVDIVLQYTVRDTKHNQIDVTLLPDLVAANYYEKVLNKILNNPSDDERYIRNISIEAYIKAINGILELKIKRGPNVIFDNFIDNYITELNEISTKGEYKIVNNVLDYTPNVETTTEELKYHPNPKQTEISNKIKEYWKDNNTPVVIKSRDEYDEVLKTKINNINNINEENNYKDLVGVELDENNKYIKPYIEFCKEFPNEPLSKKYMSGITKNGKSYFYDEKGKPIIKEYTKVVGRRRVLDAEGNKITEELVAIDKEYSMPGKPAEFSICGIDNRFARRFYDVKDPNVQVCDFIVEEINGDSGKSFCIDCVDTDNQMFIEMKYYAGINYIEQYNLNRKLKIIYINDLKQKIVNLLKEIRNKSLVDEKEKNTKKLNKIYKILTKKSLFERAFYSNNDYLGVGVTMNKFDDIVVPSDYNYKTGPNTEEKIDDVKKSVGRFYVPKFDKTRHITEIECTIKGDTAKRDNFNKQFKKVLKGKRSTSPSYKYFVTCVFKGVVGVYSYTEDDFINGNFMLGSYKCAYAFDAPTSYNAVLIPIEKFILKYLKSINKIPPPTMNLDITEQQPIISHTLVPTHTPSTSTQNKDKKKKKNQDIEV